MADFLKDYEPVEDRLRAFWSDHPNGRVMTTLIHHADGDYIVRAEVFIGDGLDWPAASGLAHDSMDQLPPNMKTSALEVCETSAIGRALANLGYAAKGKRPSREEMSKSAPSQPGADAGGRIENTSSASRESSEGTTGTEGEGVPDPSDSTSAPGEGVSSSLPPSLGADHPGPPHYPLKPEDCPHTFQKSGKRVPPRKSPRGPVCPRCGLSYIAVTEGTTADLGSA